MRFVDKKIGYRKIETNEEYKEVKKLIEMGNFNYFIRNFGLYSIIMFIPMLMDFVLGGGEFSLFSLVGIIFSFVLSLIFSPVYSNIHKRIAKEYESKLRADENWKDK